MAPAKSSNVQPGYSAKPTFMGEDIRVSCQEMNPSRARRLWSETEVGVSQDAGPVVAASADLLSPPLQSP
ncbi:hypothetical protein GCM10027432_20240 [Lysobacter fragariae]